MIPELAVDVSGSRLADLDALGRRYACSFGLGFLHFCTIVSFHRRTLSSDRIFQLSLRQPVGGRGANSSHPLYKSRSGIAQSVQLDPHLLHVGIQQRLCFPTTRARSADGFLNAKFVRLTGWTGGSSVRDSYGWKPPQLTSCR